MKLSVKNLSKSFDSSCELFKNINFELNPGELKIIMGPSGCGKSIFLKCLLGLVPPTNGTTFLDDHEVSGDDFTSLRSRAQFIGQHQLQEEGTVEEIIRKPLEFSSNKGKKFRKSEIIEKLSYFKRDLNFLNKKSFMLSGGEGQIVKILRSFNLDPELYFFDEITSAMDEELKIQVESLIKDLVNDGKGVFFITHDKLQARRLEKKVYKFPEFFCEEI